MSTQKISANDIRKGHVLAFNNDLYLVASIQVTQPGKGGAYMQVVMKSITNNTKKDQRFRTEEKVDKAILEEGEAQFLYKDDELCYFMNPVTCETFELSFEDFKPLSNFLQEGAKIKTRIYNEQVISFEFLEPVKMRLVEVNQSLKGETASSSYKPALLENGETILVPQYINECIEVEVNPETGEFKGKIK